MAWPNLFNLFGRTQSQPEGQVVNGVTLIEKQGGSSGTSVFAGYYDEEYLDELRGKERAIELDKIRRRDTQVKMLLSAVKNPIRTASREINPASDDKEHVRHAAVAKKVLFEDLKIKKIINEALTAYEFGFALFEKTHKINVNKEIKDDDGNSVLSSYIGFKKLTWLSPKTIESWNFNPETKELESVRQLVNGDLYVDYCHQVKHLSIVTIDMEGDNYEGISMIRPCYGGAKRKERYLRINAVGIEKSLPIPTAAVPSGKENTAEYANLIAALERFTSHQKNYLTYPSGWDIKLSNGTNFDPSKIDECVDREDIRMAKAFLANFLELGLSGTGAFALSNDLSDFFLGGLEYVAGLIEDMFDDLIKEIIILNFGPQEKYPKFSLAGISDKAGDEFARILGLMIDKKVVTPDDRLEDHIRKRIGITEKSDEGVREVNPAQPFQGQKFSESIKDKVRKILRNGKRAK